MGRAKGIIDIDICQGSESLRKPSIVLLFLLVKAEIFQQDNPMGRVAHDSPDFLADAIRSQHHWSLQQGFQIIPRRGQAVFGHDLSIRAPEVGGDHQLVRVL